MSVILISNTKGKIPTVSQLLTCDSGLGYNRRDALWYGLKIHDDGTKTVECLGQSITPGGGDTHPRLHSITSPSDHSAASPADFDKIVHTNAVTGAIEYVPMPLMVNTYSRIFSGNYIWDTGLEFDATECVYAIEGTKYISAPVHKEHDLADATHARIDTVYLDINSQVGIIKGTPSENPDKPNVDTTTQIELTFVVIEAGATTPNFDNILVYDENVEWQTSGTATSGTAITFNDLVNPYHGTKCIKVTSSSATGIRKSVMTFTNSAEVSFVAGDKMIFQVRSSQTWAAGSTISITLRRGNTTIGIPVLLTSNNYGNNSSVAGWHTIVIPCEDFGSGNRSINDVKMQFSNTGWGVNGFHIEFDEIKLQTGEVIIPPAVEGWDFEANDGGSFSMGRTVNPGSNLVMQLGEGLEGEAITEGIKIRASQSNYPLGGLTYKGKTATFTAGDNLVFGDLCYIADNGTLKKSNATSVVTSFAIAICLETITSGNTGLFMLSGGFIYNAAWNFNLGEPIYTSLTAGGYTQVLPDEVGNMVQLIGMPVTATTIHFTPSLSQVEIGEGAGGVQSDKVYAMISLGI